jgi:hypothetical protein
LSRDTHLRQNDYDKPGLGNLNLKFSLKIAGDPGNVGTCPLLYHSPLLVKQPSTVDVHEVIQHIFEAHPEDAIIAESVVHLLEPIGSPFFGTI